MIKEIQGDISETHCRLIAHGVNCQGVMASGVAKALSEKWPEIKNDYKIFIAYREIGENLLGKINLVEIDKGRYVVNCFTQQNYGSDKQLYLSYKALKECLIKIRAECKVIPKITEIAMPRIGCGLAGGDWSKVKQIIEEVFTNTGINVNIYYK